MPQGKMKPSRFSPFSWTKPPWGSPAGAGGAVPKAGTPSTAPAARSLPGAAVPRSSSSLCCRLGGEDGHQHHRRGCSAPGGARLVSTKVLSKPPATSHPPFPIFWGTNFLKKHGAGHRCSAHLHLTPPSKLYARAQPFCTGLGAGCRPQGPWRRPQRRPQRAQHQLSHQPVLAGTLFPRAGCLQAAPFHIGDFFFPLYRHPGRLRVAGAAELPVQFF